MHNTIHQSQKARAGASLGQSRSMPVELAAVALIAAPTCAAAGGVSVSYWYEKVRTGDAPAPVIREVRCTRWRLIDVVEFWAGRAARGVANTEAAASTMARATTASAVARRKRAGIVAAIAE